MNTMEGVIHQQPDDLSLSNSRQDIRAKFSRKLLLAVALTSTVGWIYFLSKTVLFLGAALLS